MIRLALALALLPAAATAQMTLVYSAHNGHDWVGTYGCFGSQTETDQLVVALKAALAAQTQQAVEDKINEVIQEFHGCIIGKSFDWNASAANP